MATLQHCRSCGAPVIWLKNDRTGKPAPINAEVDPNGNILMLDDGRTYRAVNRGWGSDDGESYHTSHFVSCPQRKSWRKSS